MYETSSFCLPTLYISCHWQVPKKKRKERIFWNCDLSSEIWKSEQQGRLSLCYFLLFFWEEPELFCASCIRSKQATDSILAVVLSKMWRCEFLITLSPFLRRKVRNRATWVLSARRAFILEYFCSDVNKLCLSPNLPISPCCLNLVLNFFCNSLSASDWHVHYQTSWDYSWVL